MDPAAVRGSRVYGDFAENCLGVGGRVEGISFGRYELLSLVGRGGMGEVWRAHDTLTNRIVAVKVLPAQLADDQMFQTRFRREAQAAASLSEPHVVPIHDFGEIDGRLYVDMRLIEGRDLQEVLDDGPLDPSRAVMIIGQIGSALDAAHEIGLIHRDVKPSNILITKSDFAYLIDFGIARMIGETSLTSAGSTIGTWAYMAPERFGTGAPDSRSDVYALACVLYQALTGRRPFPGESIEQQVAEHLSSPPPRPSAGDPAVPRALDDVVARGMAKSLDQRYATTLELCAAARSAVTTPLGQLVIPTDQPTLQRISPHLLPYAPTQYRDLDGPPRGDSPPPAPVATRRFTWRSPIGIAAVLAAVAVIVGTTIYLTTRPASPHVAAAAPGPTFDGTFTAAFGATTNVDGSPTAEPARSDQMWVVRSACGTTGCIATASTRGAQGDVSTLVFDYLGGQWIAVTEAPGAGCPANGSNPLWTMVSLHSVSATTLQGAYRSDSATARCGRLSSVTFTRTADADPDVPVADPSVQSPRIPVPEAEALHGHYHRKEVSAIETREDDRVGTTECLRTGDRCLSTFFVPGGYSSGVNGLVFADGRWTARSSGEGTCPAGGQYHGETEGQYPLPQPVQDPIMVLIGTEQIVFTGACDVETLDYQVTFTRTGD